MKRIIWFVVIVLAVTAAGAQHAAAQQAAAQNFTVQSVTGRVQREAGNTRVDVVAGNVLTADTVLHTGIGAALVLSDGERTYTIPAGQNGRRVADLISTGSGIRIGGNISTIDTSAAGRTTAQVSTASARASDAAGEDDIAAE